MKKFFIPSILLLGATFFINSLRLTLPFLLGFLLIIALFRDTEIDLATFLTTFLALTLITTPIITFFSGKATFYVFFILDLSLIIFILYFGLTFPRITFSKSELFLFFILALIAFTYGALIYTEGIFQADGIRFSLHGDLDLWWHISISNELIKRNVPNNPYFGNERLLYPWFYHLFLTSFYLLSGFSMLDIYRTFPILIDILFGLSVFTTAKYLLKSNFAAYITTLFSCVGGTLPIFYRGNLPLTGFEYINYKTVLVSDGGLILNHPSLFLCEARPQTVGFIFVFLGILYLFQYLKSHNWNYLFLTGAIIGVSFYFYPFPILVILPTMWLFFILHSILNGKNIEILKGFVIITGISILIATPMILYILTFSEIGGVEIITPRSLIQDRPWRIIALFKAPLFYGIPFFLVIFRIRMLINWLRKDLVLYCFSWIFYGWFSYFFVFFSPGSINQTRIVSTTIFPIVFLGVLGLDQFINSRLDEGNTHLKRLKKRYIFILVLLISLSYFSTLSAVQNKYSQPSHFSYAEYDACIWLKNNSSPDAIVVVPQEQNSPVPVFAERRILITYGYFMDGYSMVGAGWVVYVTNTIYSTENSTHAYILATKNNVQYIYINTHAREYYPFSGLQKFFEENPYFEVVYENNEVTLIYVESAK